MRTPALRVGRRRLLSAMIALVFCLSALLGLLVNSLSDRTNQEGQVSNDITQVKTLASTSHGPILIDGNAGFTNESGIVWGSGTESDPYIIEGWDIQGSHDASCIKIANADAHFVIRDCSLHDCEEGYGESGILLFMCSNGTIERCVSFNNDYGICLRSSFGNTVRSCTCQQNSYGIALDDLAHENLIEENNCSNGNGYGIYLWVSDHNTISHNDCSWNGQGICMSGADNNKFIGNKCDHTGKGYELDHCCNNSLIGNSCNYNRDEGIRLTDLSENNTLDGNNCSDNDLIGIQVVISSNNTVIRNTVFSNGGDGISVETYLPHGLSRYNLIANNTVSDNMLWGITVSSDSESNRIWNNTLICNNGATHIYNVTHIQACDDGLNNWWNSTDGYGNNWSDWTTPDDVPPYGIVDVPYNISGSAGAKDYHPLTTAPEPKPESGMMPLVVIVLLAAASVVVILLVAVVLARKARRKSV